MKKISVLLFLFPLCFLTWGKPGLGTIKETKFSCEWSRLLSSVDIATKAIKTTQSSCSDVKRPMDPLAVDPLAIPDTICLGSSTTVSANATGGTGNYTYSWNTGQTTASFTDYPTSTTTYTVTVTDDATPPATATGSVTVTVNSLPVPTLNGPSPVCVNSAGNVYTTEASMTDYVWLVTGGTITAGGNSTSNTATVTWTSVGTQSISVNYTNANGCVAITPTVKNVTVNPQPIPSLNGPSPVCVNSTGNVYTTEASMTNYLWLVTGGTITAGGNSTSNTVTITWTSVGTQSISVNYTNANGCVAITPTVKNVTVNPQPVPSLNGPSPVCVNSTGNVYTTEASMTNYLWLVTGGTITAGGNSTSNAATVTWTSVGTQSINVNYTNANGCTAITPTVKNVTVNPQPVPSLNGPSPVCVNSTGNVYTTEASMTNYVWLVIGGTITAGGDSTSNAATVTWTSVGTQSISVNYTNAYGCDAATPTVKNVTVSLQPVPSLNGPSPVCVNSSGNVYTTETSMTNYIWLVTGGTITAGGSTTSNTVTVTWTSVGTQSVSVNYTNSSGCIAVTPKVKYVVVNPLPIPTPYGDGTGCLNSTGNIYYTDSGMTNYNWTISPGGAITSGSGTKSITVTWTAMGTQWIKVNYTDANGCTAINSAPKDVNVNTFLIPSIEGNFSPCVGESIVYFTDSGKTNYDWTVSPGGTITSGSGTDSITVKWNAVGTQTVSIMYHNPNGCQPLGPHVDTVTVKDNIVLEVDIYIPYPGNTEVCVGDTVKFVANALVGGGQGANYDWYVNNNMQSIHTNEFSYTPVDNDSVKVVLSNNALCNTGPKESKKIQMTVKSSILVTVQILGDTVVCSNQPITFTASSNEGGNAPAYQWFKNGNPVGTSKIYTNQNPVNKDLIVCQFRSGLHCAINEFAYDTVVLDVSPTVTPSISIKASKNPICPGDTLVFNISDLQGGGLSPNYEWYLNGSHNPKDTNASFIPGSIQPNSEIFCKLTSSDRCASPQTINSNTISIEVLTAPPPQTLKRKSDTEVKKRGDFFLLCTTCGLNGADTLNYHFSWGYRGANGTDTLHAFDDKYFCLYPFRETNVKYFLAVSPITGSKCMTISEDSLTVNDVKSASDDLFIYPNPNDGRLFMVITSADIGQPLILIRDIAGKECYHLLIDKQNEIQKVNIDLNFLTKGIYMAEIHLSSGKIITRKILLY